MVDGMTLPYDTLVIATGAQLAPQAVPGYAEGAHHFYNAEAALRLHAALRDFQGGRVVVGVADIPYKCPPAPPHPNQFYHYEKALFNNAYWYLVPRGLV